MKPGLLKGVDFVQTAMFEVGSAMSSLCMPTPEECAPSDARHAYEHLEEAMRVLAARCDTPDYSEGDGNG